MFLYFIIKNMPKHGKNVCTNMSQKCTQMKIKNNTENEKKRHKWLQPNENKFNTINHKKIANV